MARRTKSIWGKQLSITQDTPSLLFLDGIGVRSTLEAQVTVSSAEILALNATPKTLVAAPGAGRILILEGVVLFYDYNSAAYAGIASGEDLSVKYTDGSGTAVGGCEATGFLDQTADAVRYIRPYTATSGVSDLTPVANAALVLHMLTGEITTGNSPLYARVFYRNVKLALD